MHVNHQVRSFLHVQQLCNNRPIVDEKQRRVIRFEHWLILSFHFEEHDEQTKLSKKKRSKNSFLIFVK